MKEVQLGEQTYQYIAHYKKDDRLRNRFNALTQRVWGFDFEKWYASGYWDRDCTLHSLMDGELMVAHATVTAFRVHFEGKEQIWLQLGTVMTDTSYLNRGLSRYLMERIQLEWADKCDGMFLFANDSVLDFYPKFDFEPVAEYRFSTAVAYEAIDGEVLQLNMAVQSDRDFLLQAATASIPHAALTVKNPALILFYACCCDFFNCSQLIYYVPALQTVAVVDYQEDRMLLYDVYCAQEVDIKGLIKILARPQTRRTILSFTPLDRSGFTVEPLQEDDTTLFVSKGLKPIFEESKVMIPLLSHT
ncbi:GNAT family N-acetyltransferase [Flavobacterium sp. JP2137]|uniref:GNAT family N-acetyltransferase n=1 Tax=Flavobacterium sp. JP2137 TaxID=3414510 RepID=UPI003D300935